MIEKVEFQGNHISLKTIDNWEYVSRNNISGIVVIIAITKNKEILLVEQWRPPVQANVLELPAGLAGDTEDFAGEELVTAAQRELLEETGYTSENFSLLNEGPPSPGICSEIVTVFLARNCYKIGSGGGDHLEDITVHKVPLNEAETFIKNFSEKNILIDPKIYMGLFWADKIKQISF